MSRVTSQGAVALNADGWVQLASADTTRVGLVIQNLAAEGGVKVLLRFTASDPGAGVSTGYELGGGESWNAPTVSAAWARASADTPSAWVIEEHP